MVYPVSAPVLNAMQQQDGFREIHSPVDALGVVAGVLFLAVIASLLGFEIPIITHALLGDKTSLMILVIGAIFFVFWFSS
jgi:hypothetical protein